MTNNTPECLKSLWIGEMTQKVLTATVYTRGVTPVQIVSAITRATSNIEYCGDKFRRVSLLPLDSGEYIVTIICADSETGEETIDYVKPNGRITHRL